MMAPWIEVGQVLGRRCSAGPPGSQNSIQMISYHGLDQALNLLGARRCFAAEMVTTNFWLEKQVRRFVGGP